MTKRLLELEPTSLFGDEAIRTGFNFGRCYSRPKFFQQLFRKFCLQ